MEAAAVFDAAVSAFCPQSASMIAATAMSDA